MRKERDVCLESKRLCWPQDYRGEKETHFFSLSYRVDMARGWDSGLFWRGSRVWADSWGESVLSHVGAKWGQSWDVHWRGRGGAQWTPAPQMGEGPIIPLWLYEPSDHNYFKRKLPRITYLELESTVVMRVSWNTREKVNVKGTSKHFFNWLRTSFISRSQYFTQYILPNTLKGKINIINFSLKCPISPFFQKEKNFKNHLYVNYLQT